MVTVLVEAISLVWGPAKDATVPNLVPRHRLEAANQVSLATTYGSALPAAAIFAGLTLVDKFYRHVFDGLHRRPDRPRALLQRRLVRRLRRSSSPGSGTSRSGPAVGRRRGATRSG